MIKKGRSIVLARKKKNKALRSGGINPAHFERGQIKFLLILLPMCIVMALPLIFIFFNAFKPMDELFAFPPRFYVKNPTFENFIDLFAMASNTKIPATRYIFNSIVSTVAVVLCTLIISVSAGYVLSKKRFRLKNAMFTINNLGLMFVPIAVAIPRYFIIVYSGLQNNFLANIVPLLVTPTGVFLIKQFIDQMPDALIEAAVIDGASDYQILRRIVIPLVNPAIATVTLTTFQSAWASSEASTLFIDNEALKTFSFYISSLSGSAGGIAGVGIGAAASLIMFLPNLIVFIVMQSRVMNTMMHSGIK